MRIKDYSEMKDRVVKRTALLTQRGTLCDKITRTNKQENANRADLNDGKIDNEEYKIEWERCKDLLKYYRNKVADIDLKLEDMEAEGYTNEVHEKEGATVMKFEASKSELEMVEKRLGNLEKAKELVKTQCSITVRCQGEESEIFLFSAEEVGAICQGLQHIINSEKVQVERIRGEMEAM